MSDMLVNEIRKYIENFQLDGVIFFKRDLFSNGHCFKETDVIKKISGFSGSYAVLLITKTKVHIFTDFRYEKRITKEINDGIEIHFEYYKKIIKDLNITKIGFEPLFANYFDVENIDDVQFISVDNIISDVFGKVNLNGMQVFKDIYSDPFEKKLEIVLQKMNELSVDAYFFESESMSWLFNERSNAIKHYPINLGFCLLLKNGDYKRFSPEEVYSGDFIKHISKIENLTISIDYKIIPYKFINQMFTNNIVKNNPDIIMSCKIVKTATEIRNMKKAHIRDSFVWLYLIDWIKNSDDLSEFEILQKIKSLKENTVEFYDESFESIVANSVNASSIHYSTLNENQTKVDFMVLIDSGTQYKDGTTDITRCITTKNSLIPDYAKYYYTLVLKAHVNFSMAIFPKKSKASDLNAIGRNVLWKKNIDFKHGFGHGIGCFLNIHEPYLSINNKSTTELVPGMILSNEPGVYISDKIGIRIENAVLIEEGDNEFCNFITLDFVPFEKSLIDLSLLNDEEIFWINNYYEQAIDTLHKNAETEKEHYLIDKYFENINL